MRFPLLALCGALVAAPAIATASYIPEPMAQPQVAVSEPAPPSVADSVSQNAAGDAQPVFSEPTEPVPLLPSQRKLLRMRKV